MQLSYPMNFRAGVEGRKRKFSTAEMRQISNHYDCASVDDCGDRVIIFDSRITERKPLFVGGKVAALIMPGQQPFGAPGNTGTRCIGVSISLLPGFRRGILAGRYPSAESLAPLIDICPAVTARSYFDHKLILELGELPLAQFVALTMAYPAFVDECAVYALNGPVQHSSTTQHRPRCDCARARR